MRDEDGAKAGNGQAGGVEARLEVVEALSVGHAGESREKDDEGCE